MCQHPVNWKCQEMEMTIGICVSSMQGKMLELVARLHAVNSVSCIAGMCVA
jgi:hypothetical protein